MRQQGKSLAAAYQIAMLPKGKKVIQARTDGTYIHLFVPSNIADLEKRVDLVLKTIRNASKREEQ